MTRLVGITGGIGSGKSFFARKKAKEGFLVFDTDKESKRIVEENAAVRAKIIALLGEQAYSDGKYQTKYVASKVFDSQSGAPLLQALNAIVHPAVKAELLRWKEAHAAEEILFVESAILFESGLDELCDEIICITAPQEVCIARVMARDNVSEQAVRDRMARQMPDAERQRRSTIVIHSA